MSTQHLRNVSIAKFEAFLELAGCSMIRHSDGHYKWSRADLGRPITFQDHVDPVPEFIIQNNLRTLGYNKKIFFEILEGKKEVVRDGDVFTLIVIEKKKK